MTEMMHRVVAINRRSVKDAHGRHAHVDGVFTDDGVYHTTSEVARRLGQGEQWVAFKGGLGAPLKLSRQCLVEPSCSEQMYLTARGDWLEGFSELMPPSGMTMPAPGSDRKNIWLKSVSVERRTRRSAASTVTDSWA